MAAIVAHHTLRDAGRARGIEDVERVGRQHRHAAGGLGRGGELAPVMVAPGDQRRLTHRPLQDHAVLGLGARLGDRRVEQRLVGDHPADLDAAGGREHDPRPGVVDAGRQLMRGEPAEDDRMHGADAGAGQHRHRRLRRHRHVDQDAVALADAEPRQHAREPRHLVAQFAIGEALDLPRHRAVPDQRRALAAAGRDMAVERVPAGIQPCPGEPAVKRRPAVVEHPVPPPLPIDRLGGLGPEFLRPLPRPAIGLGIAHLIRPGSWRSVANVRFGVRVQASWFCRLLQHLLRRASHSPLCVASAARQSRKIGLGIEKIARPQ